MGKKIRLNFTVEEIAFLIIWAVFFMPPMISRMSTEVSYVITLLGYGTFLLMFLHQRKDFPASKDVMYIFLFLFYCFIIVLIKTPDEFPVYARRSLLPVLESIFLIRWSFEGRKKGFRALYLVSSFYIIANFLSIVLFPAGLFKSSLGSSVRRTQWLFGSKNNIPLYIICFITIAAYYYYTVSRTRMFYVLVLMGAFSIAMSGEEEMQFFGGSSTGLIAYLAVLVLIAYYMHMRRANRPALGVKLIFVLLLLLNLLLLTGQSIPGMDDLIVNVFHKSLTFSGRTVIWQTHLRAFAEHPLFGHGEEEIISHVYLLGDWIYTDYTYNCLLKLLVNYGIIGLGLFTVMILKIDRGNETGDRILFSGFAGIMIIGLMNEIDLNWLLFFPLILTLHYKPLPVVKRKGEGKQKPEKSLGLRIKF